jgi:16S rRNA C967 or C1407 C5-methylase (RsmB/RsmF family)/NOL1/NOP2/fmu family ribosome biogenesis protein
MDPFQAALLGPPTAGLRVNRLKLEPEAFATISPFPLAPVPWCAEGFVLRDLPGAVAAARPGRHPYHAAGLYYLQDPSAMAAAELLLPQPGERVLDLSAAPGGKATHIAARLGRQGLLVANEVVRARAGALIENLERCGVTNALVTSEPAETLAERWPDGFDRVLLDAPCSAEGMFRKSATARREWRPSVVEGCAARQATILPAAARLVRPGGRLLYATCTFAPEENETVIAAFLRAQPEFHLVEPPRLPGFDRGRPEWIEPALAAGLPLERCVRLWPHRAAGEGHFFAILEKAGNEPAASLSRGRPERLAEPSPELRDFWRATVRRPLPDNGLSQAGEWVHWLPARPDNWQPLRPLRAGWRLARMAPGRVEPAHALALALAAGDVVNKLELSPTEALGYLRGEPQRSAGPEGWLLVCVAGLGLGWGKRVGGQVKNHYPKGLRQ